jgi:tetratricopeptide (TPR) repeat protein
VEQFGEMEKISGYALVIARTRVSQECNKPLIGKPYLKYAQCFALWSYFFQLGGILAAKYSANLDAFGQAFLGAQGPPGAVKKFFGDVAERLMTSFPIESMTLADYVNSEFTERVHFSGDATAFLLEHRMKKIESQTAVELAWQYSQQGAALGATQPQILRKMFERTYTVVPTEEWQLARAAGLNIPPKQEVVSYGDIEEAEDAVFMAYCQECCPSLYQALTHNRHQSAEDVSDENRTLLEDEGISEKMLAYREAVARTIEIDNDLLSGCRDMLDDEYGASGLLVCDYADIIGKGTIENSRSRSQSELPATPEEIRQAIIQCMETSITKSELESVEDILRAAYSFLARFLPDAEAALVTARNACWFSEDPNHSDLQIADEAEQIDAKVDKEEGRLEQEFDELSIELLKVELARVNGEQTKAAKRLLNAFRELNPDDPSLTDDLVHQEYSQLDLEEGTSARNTRDAIVAWKKGDRELALRLFTTAIDIDPNDAGALLNRGNLQLELGLYESGIRDLEKAGEIDPELPWQNALLFKMLNAEERENTRQTMLKRSVKTN